MHRRQHEKRWGARAVAAIFAVGVAACDSSEGLFPLPCPVDAYRCVITQPDASSSDSTGNHPPDGSAYDVAVTRSPLCAVVGCYPGNPSACGATPPPDASAWLHPADTDANDDVAADDASADAGPSPA